MRKLTLAILLIASLGAGYAQEPKKSFDVVSVKPAAEGQRSAGSACTSGHYSTIDNLRALLISSYAIDAKQLAGLPRWAETEKFEIQATSSGAPTRDDCRRMVQTLLEDRFALKTHREIRLTDALILTVAKNGPRFRPAEDSPDGNGVKIMMNGTLTRAGSVTPGPAPEIPRGLTMQQLIQIVRIADPDRRMIVDRTGLTERYQFSLEFATPGLPGAPPIDAPDIFTALRQQLGVNLEVGKADVEILVIDRLERPSVN